MAIVPGTTIEVLISIEEDLLMLQIYSWHGLVSRRLLKLCRPTWPMISVSEATEMHYLHLRCRWLHGPKLHDCNDSDRLEAIPHRPTYRLTSTSLRPTLFPKTHSRIHPRRTLIMHARELCVSIDHDGTRAHVPGLT
jgi:hypothetical protein